MKKYALLLFMPLTFWACANSDDEPEPATAELATPLIGVYALNYYRIDTTAASSKTPFTFETNVPVKYADGSTYSASFTVRRDSASVIFVTFTEKQTGYNDQTSNIGQIKVKGTAAPYDLLNGNTIIGTADGTNFNFDISYTDNAGTRFREIYKAKKQP
jgi:hypothetical protein